MGWKYIMFENTLAGGTKFLFPVIFPDKMVHKHVAQLLQRAMPGYYAKGVVPVSAGTIEHLEIDGLGGESTTLDLRSKPSDRSVIESYSYTHGVL